MATDYLSIASTLQQQNYEAQNITVSGNNAFANVTTLAGPILIQIDLHRAGVQWVISP
jgi:hypothetical protein